MTTFWAILPFVKWLQPPITPDLVYSIQNTIINTQIPPVSISKINPANCVDMECDALKKAILRDVYGTFLRKSIPGTIIPESEWAWDQDPARGIGDYRIPTSLLTDEYGNRIPAQDVALYRGVDTSLFCMVIVSVWLFAGMQFCEFRSLCVNLTLWFRSYRKIHNFNLHGNDSLRKGHNQFVLSCFCIL